MSLIEYPNSDYNSWISDADEYFESRLNADAWDALTNKEPALITAFRSLAELNLDIVFDENGVISTNIYTTSEVTR